MTVQIINNGYRIGLIVFFKDEHLEYEDNFGRKWKLVPNINENIVMPFIITPIGDGK